MDQPLHSRNKKPIATKYIPKLDHQKLDRQEIHHHEIHHQEIGRQQIDEQGYKHPRSKTSQQTIYRLIEVK